MVGVIFSLGVVLLVTGMVLMMSSGRREGAWNQASDRA